MRLLAIFIFFLFTNQVEILAQNYAKFIVLPKLGTGINLRSPAKLTSGNNLIQPLYNSLAIGTAYDSENNSTFYLNANRFAGLEFRYGINRNFAISTEIGNTKQIVIDASPERWVNQIEGYGNWYAVFTYNSLNLGLARTWYGFGNKFSYLKGSILTYSVDKTPVKSQSISNDFRDNNTGTGVVISVLNKNVNRFGLGLEYGKFKPKSLYLPFGYEWSLGINIPLKYLDKRQFTYYNNGKIQDVNEVKYSQSSVWLKVAVPVYKYDKKAKSNSPKLPKAKKEKPKTNTDEVKYDGKKIKNGESIILKSISFDQASSTLKPNSYLELNKLKIFLKENPDLKVEIIGHTSSEGVRSDNIKLSKNRAESCKEYLKNNGIKSKRIKTIGMGPDNPISPSNKEINRRVEFRIVND